MVPETQPYLWYKLHHLLDHPLELELELNRKDGSTFWAEVTVTALRDQDGQPVGFVGVARDITERKYAEELKKSKGTNNRPVK